MTESEILKLAKEHHAEIQRPFAPHEFSIHAYLFNERYLIAFARAVQEKTREECIDIAWEYNREGIEAVEAAIRSMK